MLEKISWTEYLIGVGSLLLLYYLLIGFKYFRKEINLKFKEKMDAEQLFPEAHEKEISEDGLFGELEELTDRIRHGIFELAGKGADKEQLLKQIKPQAAKFSGLQIQAYQYALNNFIIHYGKEICGVRFSEGELEAVWKELPR